METLSCLCDQNKLNGGSYLRFAQNQTGAFTQVLLNSVFIKSHILVIKNKNSIKFMVHVVIEKNIHVYSCKTLLRMSFDHKKDSVQIS